MIDLGFREFRSMYQFKSDQISYSEREKGWEGKCLNSSYLIVLRLKHIC